MLVPIETVFSSCLVFPYPHTKPQLCCGYSWKMIVSDYILHPPNKTGLKIWCLCNFLLVEHQILWIFVCKRCLSCMCRVRIFVGLPYWIVFCGHPKKSVTIYERQCILILMRPLPTSPSLCDNRQGTFGIKISVFSYISESMLVCDVSISHVKATSSST